MLNRTEGEDLPILGRGKVVDTDKWAGVFDMLEVAAGAAASEFRKKGAPWPVKFAADNVLVQEYHLQGIVMWLFWLRIKGEDYYYHYKFELGNKVIGELVSMGMWPQIMPIGARKVLQ